LLLSLPSNLPSQTSSGAQLPGHIDGIVVSPQDQPVWRAAVTAKLEGNSGNQIHAGALTEPDGSFVIPKVSPGHYRICIQTPGTALLDPCTWSASPPGAVVSSGATASLGSIRLESGYVIRVRLHDAARLLQTDEARTPAARVQSGVWTPSGLFIPLRIRTRGSVSRDLELPVPHGMPLELSVRSTQFELVDENNNPVDPRRGSVIAIPAASGAPSIVHEFRVTRRRPAP
jgi:hypothetical protein